MMLTSFFIETHPDSSIPKPINSRCIIFRDLELQRSPLQTCLHGEDDEGRRQDPVCVFDFDFCVVTAREVGRG